MRPADLLIGIDDTDELEGKGTGFLARRLMETLEQQRLGRGLGITRHQLLVDDRIPYTSHNSSACLGWTLEPGVSREAVIESAGSFLDVESAPGSDPGLAVADAAALIAHGAALAEHGHRAKTTVLDRPGAESIARAAGVHLSAHGGTGGGVIGALAGVGLRHEGDDGWFLWMPGVRGLTGSMTYERLRRLVPIDAARGPDGEEPRPTDVIDLGDWVRPVLEDGCAVLLLQPAVGETTSTAGGNADQPTWAVLAKEAVKAR